MATEGILVKKEKPVLSLFREGDCSFTGDEVTVVDGPGELNFMLSLTRNQATTFTVKRPKLGSYGSVLWDTCYVDFCYREHSAGQTAGQTYIALQVIWKELQEGDRKHLFYEGDYNYITRKGSLKRVIERGAS